MKYDNHSIEHMESRQSRWQAEERWITLRKNMTNFLDQDIPFISKDQALTPQELFPAGRRFNERVRLWAYPGDLNQWDLSGFDFGWLTTTDVIGCEPMITSPIFLNHTYQGIHLHGSLFRRISFHGAIFEHCTFDDALFQSAIFDHCAFRSCSFNRGHFHGFHFNGSLERCEFYDAEITNAEFNVVGRPSCEWDGARVVGEDSLRLRFTESVLRSIAFSNYQLFLDIRRWNMDPRAENFHSVFLSHSTMDNAFANRIAQDLADHGVRVWIDEAEIKVGDSLIAKIGEGIVGTEYLVVVLSSDSVKSSWVQKELAIALTQEINGRRVRVLPILISECEIPPFLVDKVYSDFRDPTKYYEGVGRILDAVSR